MARNSIDMCGGPLYKNILRYTLPIMLTGFLQLLFTAADLVIVGMFCGSSSVAAVGATNALINLIVNFFMGLSVGVSARVSFALGAEDHKEVHRTVHTAILTALICGALLTVIGLLWTPGMLEIMKTPRDILPLSSLYTRIYFCGMIPSMLYNFGAAVLRSAGETRLPLLFLASAGVLNVGLNIMFVTLFDMDVEGVALATSLSQVLSAALVLVALAKRKDSCRFSLRKLRIHGRVFGKIVQIGLPAGLQSSLFAISNVIIQSSINSFGSVAVVSGSSAAASLEGFCYISMNSFQQTALNFVGRNYGANQAQRIGKILRACLLLVGLTGAIFTVILIVWAEPLLSIYIKDSQEAIQYGVLRITYFCIPFFLCGMMEVMTGAIRGYGSSLAPMLATILGVCGFRILWVYTVFDYPPFHTLPCLFLSYPISWALTFGVLVVIYIIVARRRKRQIEARLQTGAS